MGKITPILTLCFLMLIASCNSKPQEKVETKPEKNKIETPVKKKKVTPPKEKAPEKVEPPVKKEEVKTPLPDAPTPAPSPAAAKADVKTLSSAAFKATMLDLVNAQRKNGCVCGGRQYPAVPALKWDAVLQQIALSHSSDMASNSKLSHTGSNGSEASDRLNSGGYSWASYGENVAAGQQNIQEVVNSWIKSSGHCKNIMKPELKEVGVAQVNRYWTMVLAAPREPAL